MNMSHRFHSQPDSSADTAVSNDLVKQIRKLRWIGLDDEARLLESALTRMRAADVVLAAPSETD